MGTLCVFILMCLSSLLDGVLSQCDGTPLTVSATEVPARFVSPGYTAGGYVNNLSCEWLLDSGVDGQAILLYSDHYALASGDVINIYDGRSKNDPLLATNISKIGTSRDYSSTGRHVLVTMTTDARQMSTGFEMTYLSAPDTSGTGCKSEYTLTASTSPQYLTSQGFPGRYASSSYCRWRIVASNPVNTVTITIMFNEIENDVACLYDKYTVYDGSYVCENKVVFTKCPRRTVAGEAPTKFTSSGNSTLIVMTSDTSFERRGFVMEYTENFRTTTSVVTTPSLTTAMTSSGAGFTEAKNETDDDMPIPMMIDSALAGAAVVLAVFVGYRLVTYTKRRQHTQKNNLTV